MNRRYVKLLAQILRLSWRHYPHATAGLLAVRAVGVGMTAAIALALRGAINGIIGGHLRAAVIGAAGAAVVFAADSYLRDLGRILDIMLVDRLGAMHLRPLIEGRLARLDGLEHLERTDLLDRVTVLRGAAWQLSLAPWSAVTAVFAVHQAGRAARVARCRGHAVAAAPARFRRRAALVRPPRPAAGEPKPRSTPRRLTGCSGTCSTSPPDRPAARRSGSPAPVRTWPAASGRRGTRPCGAGSAPASPPAWQAGRLDAVHARLRRRPGAGGRPRRARRGHRRRPRSRGHRRGHPARRAVRGRLQRQRDHGRTDDRRTVPVAA